MTRIPDQEIEAVDLGVAISAIVGDGRVRAHYAAGDSVMETHGARHILSIDVTNSNCLRRPAAERDELLARVAQTGAEWLRRRGLLLARTLVSIILLREVDLRLVSWAWGVGGRAYWVDASGEITEKGPGQGAA